MALRRIKSVGKICQMSIDCHALNVALETCPTVSRTDRTLSFVLYCSVEVMGTGEQSVYNHSKKRNVISPVLYSSGPVICLKGIPFNLVSFFCNKGSA